MSHASRQLPAWLIFDVSQRKLVYRIFYNCQSTDDRIDSANAIVAEKDTVIDLAPQMLLEPDDFFGVIDAEGRTLQFMLEVGDRVWMEIPAPKEKGSYGVYLELSELKSVLLSLPAAFQPEAFSKMAFSSW